MGIAKEYHSRSGLGAQARKKLNPQSIAVSLSWYDRTSGKFCVYFHTGVPQSYLDADYMLAARKSKMQGLGSGDTLDLAVADVEHKVYGGL